MDFQSPWPGGRYWRKKRKQPEHHWLPFSASWLRTWCEQSLQFLWLWSLFLPQWVVFPCLCAKIKIFSLKLLCHFFFQFLIAATRNISGAPWTTEMCSLISGGCSKIFHCEHVPCFLYFHLSMERHFCFLLICNKHGAQWFWKHVEEKNCPTV